MIGRERPKAANKRTLTLNFTGAPPRIIFGGAPEQNSALGY
jgi:hypothetical protein